MNETSFNLIKNDKYLKMILQNLLTIGNLLNAGNTKKGQADGFDLGTLDLAFSKKDNNKKSLIVTIIHQIMKEDEKFVFF